MSDENNGGAKSRLDRIEGLLEVQVNEHIQFHDEHRQLLTAQVLLTDSLRQLAEAQRHTDEKLHALIAVVDDLVRRQPPRP